MRSGIIVVAAFVLMLALPLRASAAELAIINGSLVISGNGLKTEELGLSELRLQPVNNSGLRFVALNEELAASLQQFSLAPALYFFDAGGKLVARFAFEDTDICYDASLSPSGTVIALDSGTWVVRAWSFFTFPDFKPLGASISYFNEDDPALLWVDDRRVLYTSLTGPDLWRERQCGYDPCGATSVILFDLDGSRKTTLMEGVPLCDYRVVSVSGEEFTARSLCRKNAVDWGQPGKPEEKMVKGHLPAIRR